MATTKTVKTEKAIKQSAPKEASFNGRFKQAMGGRKTASASVRIFSKSNGIVVNGKDYTEYFVQPRHQLVVTSPLEITDMQDVVGFTVVVQGSGTNAQAEAVRHGIATALVAHDPELRKALKREGFLTRDSRVVERKKYGLKKARKSPQWAKR